MFVDFIFIKLWSPIIGEKDSESRHKKQKEEDEFAIGVYRYDLQRVTMVGHIPRKRSKLYTNFCGFPIRKFTAEFQETETLDTVRKSQ